MLSVKYPIYIVSKGRAYNPLTAKMFLKENIDFKIVIEPQEYENYCKIIPKKNILILPFSNLGVGSYPARNYCWKDSMKNGHKKHFIFDDNIYRFQKLNYGIRNKEHSAYDALKNIIKFSDKYKNIAIIGYNYSGLVTQETKKPFVINTHVYSAMLISNEIPFRWRLKYNEDVDLCLQVLNSKYWCTILINVFLIKKVSTTSKMKGGNQEELYQNNAFEKKLLKARSLEKIWPQYVKVVWRFKRPHHYVNWNKYFKQPLKKMENLTTT